MDAVRDRPSSRGAGPARGGDGPRAGGAAARGGGPGLPDVHRDGGRRGAAPASPGLAVPAPDPGGRRARGPPCLRGHPGTRVGLRRAPQPEQWKDPDRFDPERFRPGAGQDRDRSAYVPFGGGRRQCIGKRVGLSLLRQTVAAVHGRFRLTVADARPPRNGAYITLFPKDGIRVTAEERHR
ncbi:cytochrome P450 [Streptomyces tendae]|uniref:Cytochrome P450 n=1 Tax=Streptomyces tendae TaxID=1932 RepID=A0ABX5ZRK0_STRTE|nr:cytochrome P450 [Streptomyces tendae]